MSFKDSKIKLEKSQVYIAWKKDHQKSYITYCFLMLSDDVKKEWQIGYYNPGNDTISTFAVGDEIMKNPESEIFKNDSKVLKLEIDKVNTTLEFVLDKAEKLQKEEYPQHKPIKTMVILQKLSIGQVWNLTYITSSFKTINIKIDSNSGEILKYNLVELFSIDTAKS